jgi:hypothetical protein
MRQTRLGRISHWIVRVRAPTRHKSPPPAPTCIFTRGSRSRTSYAVSAAAKAAHSFVRSRRGPQRPFGHHAPIFPGVEWCIFGYSYRKEPRENGCSTPASPRLSGTLIGNSHYLQVLVQLGSDVHSIRRLGFGPKRQPLCGREARFLQVSHLFQKCPELVPTGDAWGRTTLRKHDSTQQSIE